jgi:hypothetical protein
MHICGFHGICHTVQINIGQQTLIRPFLAITTVSYSWSVVPTSVLDVYTFVLTADFVTYVPDPVVTVNPPYYDIDAYVQYGIRHSQFSAFTVDAFVCFC